MNEDKWLFTTDKLMPIEEIISNIEKYGYIDAYLGYEDGFLVDSILCFLKENQQLKDNWNMLKNYCQDNSFMQNTREYGTLTVVDADELAIYMEELESGDSNENRGNNKVMEQI